MKFSAIVCQPSTLRMLILIIVGCSMGFLATSWPSTNSTRMCRYSDQLLVSSAQPAIRALASDRLHSGSI